VDHRGMEAAPLDLRQVTRVRNILAEKGISCAGVAGKFSTRNPDQELQVKEHLIGLRHVSLGHRMSGGLNFPRRISTTYLNAAVWELHNHFTNQTRMFFNELNLAAPLYILKADGGTFSIESSVDLPAQTILSGPAASIMGIMAATREDKNAIALDIGGTTTDIAILARGVPLLEPLGAIIGGHKTAIRAMRTRSIGVGGDSRISFAEGVLVIGPQREGPAAALGGPAPTPTDAMVLLGLAGLGRTELAAAAMTPLAREMRLSLLDTARAVLNRMCVLIGEEIEREISSINQRPVYTVREYLEGWQFHPEILYVVGGPAEIMARRLGSHLACPFYVPPDAEVANAFGAALSRVTMEMTMNADTERRLATISEEGQRFSIPAGFTIREAKTILRERLREKASGMGVTGDEVEIDFLEELEYPMIRDHYRTGQNIRIRAQLKPGLSRSDEAVKLVKSE
ncbi:MAG: hydantoinase/oxoprolinase family protein, partial [Smithellaceae bacterium]|nr:hydantoinase/oxoprolinase family protein [Smithellaceae bacterium]